MTSQGGEMQHITEETQRIIEQIQSQLDSHAANQPDGQPLQVAYQIIHDDDNQQVLEIQYHQVMEVEDAVKPAKSLVQQDQGEQKDGQAVLRTVVDSQEPNVITFYS